MSANENHKPEHGNVQPERLEWTPELVERFWNGIAQTRLIESSFARTGGRSLLTVIDHLLSPQLQILDFGAGDGDLVLAMCGRGFQVAAYEPSEMRSGNLQLKLNGVVGFLGMVADAAPVAFDVVTMTEVIEHVLNPEMDACLSRVRSLVKMGGLLVVTTPNNEDLELSMAYCPLSNMLFHRWQHVRSFTPATLSAELASYGFKEVATHCIQFVDDFFVPFDRLWGQGIPEKDWPQHMRDMRANKGVYVGQQSTIVYIGIRES